MKIELEIDICSLGENTKEENQRFVKTVAQRINEQYPCAEISIKLGSYWTTCRVDIDRDGSMVEKVLEIANEVWEDENY